MTRMRTVAAAAAIAALGLMASAGTAAACDRGGDAYGNETTTVVNACNSIGLQEGLINLSGGNVCIDF
ncbi:hypothetical protein [Streptomyces sp. JJ38]|uniref:hypothetical protein n=1 Tax=Streptomyces sp. JJ38 TaxID=2738128 RepID=UPI001C568F24|nr:hypothetical protein [Streptomyces sp. JJ38]MBW1598045.1 hypothetical protein [Streptomyces sp. JJ38]